MCKNDSDTIQFGNLDMKDNDTCYDDHNNELVRNFGPDSRLLFPTKGSSAPVSSVLTLGKITLLYFSAFWCGPCKKITPVLKEWYLSMKQRQEEHENFELIYVTLDAFETEYNHYTKDMPWWCIPFNSPISRKISSKYNLGGGIPCLVVIDADGQTILSQDAVSLVTSGRDVAAQFPWRPRPIMKLLPDTYLHNNTSLPINQLHDKYLLIFAGGHWCEPCRTFSKNLSEAYIRLKQRRNDFELLYLSSDLDEDSFLAFYSTLPFGAIPYEHRDAKMAIANKYSISHIPTVIVLGPVVSGDDRPVINGDARAIFEGEALCSGRYLSEFPYVPKRYEDLNRTTHQIHNVKAVVIFCEYCDDCEQADVEGALRCAAQSYKGQDDLKFFWVCQPTVFSETLRGTLSLPTSKSGNIALQECTRPVMVYLDFLDDGSYYVAAGCEITSESILTFLKSPGSRLRVG